MTDGLILSERLILSIETTGKRLGVAVTAGNRVLGEIARDSGEPHAVTLMPAIDELLRGLSLGMRDMAAIACSAGPGSFTGVKIGAAAAKGLAMGANLPIIPVPTLAALAYNIHGCTGRLAPIIDARRDQVYSAFYIYESGLPKPAAAADCRLMADVLKIAADMAEPVIFTGDGAILHRERILDAGFETAPPSAALQSAASVGLLAARLPAMPAEDFTPEYIRKHEAEINLEAKRCRH